MVAMMQLIETVVSSVVVVHISDSNVRLSTISMRKHCSVVLLRILACASE